MKLRDILYASIGIGLASLVGCGNGSPSNNNDHDNYKPDQIVDVYQGEDSQDENSSEDLVDDNFNPLDSDDAFIDSNNYDNNGIDSDDVDDEIEPEDDNIDIPYEVDSTSDSEIGYDSFDSTDSEGDSSECEMVDGNCLPVAKACPDDLRDEEGKCLPLYLEAGKGYCWNFSNKPSNFLGCSEGDDVFPPGYSHEGTGSWDPEGETNYYIVQWLKGENKIDSQGSPDGVFFKTLSQKGEYTLELTTWDDKEMSSIPDEMDVIVD